MTAITLAQALQAVEVACIDPRPNWIFHQRLGPQARFFKFSILARVATLPTATSWTDFTRIKEVYYLHCLEITNESVAYANEQSAKFTGKSKLDTFRIEEL